MAIRKTREELDAEMASAETADSEEVADSAGAAADESTEVAAAEPGSAAALEDVDLDSPQPSGVPESAPAPTPRLKLAIESLLFASPDPLGLPGLLEVLSEFHADLNSRGLRQAIEELRVELREQGRGIRIAEVAGGFQLRTPSEAAPYVKKLLTRRPPRLTQATLECLAIVAYRQPITRGEVEDIRGVDSGAVLRNLLQKKLLKIMGRKEEPGRPLLYGTSKEFLEFFSMKDLGSLPTLKDFAELSEEHRESLGLEPIEEETAEDAQPEVTASLTMEDPNAYAPPGDDQVVQELAEALDELRKRDRRLKKEVFGSTKPAPSDAAAQPGDGVGQPGDGAAQPAPGPSGDGGVESPGQPAGEEDGD